MEVDNAADGGCKVVTGSLQGMLRLYSPRRAAHVSQDLLLEQPLDHPILQLEVGKFMMHGEQLAVAVLHPRRLVVYSIEYKTSVHTAEVLYRHDLTANNSGESFTAFNMCFGTFGGRYTSHRSSRASRALRSILVSTRTPASNQPDHLTHNPPNTRQTPANYLDPP